VTFQKTLCINGSQKGLNEESECLKNGGFCKTSQWMIPTVQQIWDRYWYCIVLSLFGAWYWYQHFFCWWETPLSRIWIYEWKKKIVFVFFIFSSRVLIKKAVFSVFTRSFSAAQRMGIPRLHVVLYLIFYGLIFKFFFFFFNF
jgi:hypothetical protein